MNNLTSKEQLYHTIKTSTEIIVVPLHYAALFHQHFLAFCVGVTTLVIYTGATVMFHMALVKRR